MDIEVHKVVAPPPEQHPVDGLQIIENKQFISE
jgi:hypothetical protein